MYCPRCSQQQLPEEFRFCSRCGLQLVAVSQLLNNEGMNFINPNYPPGKLPLVKRQELRKGAKLIFLSFFSVIPSFILAVICDSPLPLIMPLIAFLVGLAQIIYYFLFGESLLRPRKQKQSFEYSEYEPRMNYQSAPTAPPPPQRLPFSVVDSKPLNTSDFAQPFSGPGRATNFLNNK